MKSKFYLDDNNCEKKTNCQQNMIDFLFLNSTQNNKNWLNWRTLLHDIKNTNIHELEAVIYISNTKHDTKKQTQWTHLERSTTAI